MSKSSDPAPSTAVLPRRRLLAALVAMPALAAAVRANPASGADDDDRRRADASFRETDHIRTYYALARY
jgi:hypothetical protein